MFQSYINNENTYETAIFSRFVIIIVRSWNFTTPEAVLT